MGPEDRKPRGQSAHYQVIDEAQVLMAGPDGAFKPLGFLSEDGFAWSADGGEHHGADLATNAHDAPSAIERSWSFTPIEQRYFEGMRQNSQSAQQTLSNLEERNSYQTRIEPQLLEGSRRVTGRTLLDLMFGGPTLEQDDLLRRLNMRWRDRIEPGIPKHARHVLAGPPEPKHYVYAKMADGQTIIGAMTDQPPSIVDGPSTTSYSFDIDPQRSKQDPAFNLTHPKG